MKNLKMNFFLPVTIIIFVLGFILGRITNDTNRYTYDLKGEHLAIFDSKTGKIYVQDNSESNTKYFVIDAINAEVENYKRKAKK